MKGKASPSRRFLLPFLCAFFFFAFLFFGKYFIFFVSFVGEVGSCLFSLLLAFFMIFFLYIFYLKFLASSASKSYHRFTLIFIFRLLNERKHKKSVTILISSLSF